MSHRTMSHTHRSLRTEAVRVRASRNNAGAE